LSGRDALDGAGRDATGDRAAGTSPETGHVAGIDIGGTKIAVLVVDRDGVVRGRATHAASVGDQTPRRVRHRGRARRGARRREPHP
jgi:hypothetical protein